MPDLRPDSPIQGMQEMLNEERPSITDIEGYIAKE